MISLEYIIGRDKLNKGTQKSIYKNHTKITLSIRKILSLFSTLPFIFFPYFYSIDHYLIFAYFTIANKSSYTSLFSLTLNSLFLTLLSKSISNKTRQQTSFQKLQMYVTKQIQNKIKKKKINFHQRSILREMMNTCDKLDGSFLTRVEQKKFQQKQKQEKQLTRKSSFIDKQSLQRFSHDPFRCTKDSIMEDFVFVKESKQIKQIKDLKQKMLPKVNKTNIQKKLKEITYIRNMGFRTKNKKLESFKSLTKEQDEENILNKSWQNFYQDKIRNPPVESLLQGQGPKDFVRSTERKRTKKTAYFLGKDKINSSNELDDTQNSCLKVYNKFTESSPSSFMKKDSKLSETTEKNLNRTNYGFSCKGDSQQINENQKKQLQVTPRSRQGKSPISVRNKRGFKDLIKNLSRANSRQSYNPKKGMHLLSSERKREVTEKMGITKERLEKQNAYELYSLIKGGYILDRNDVEGEQISLKRFKEAKESFKILKNCFNKVRQCRYIVQEPQKVFNDCSFKSLVYLSEIQYKIPPALFKKVQKMNNVVD